MVKRYELEATFRAMLCGAALRKVGSDAQVGRMLGYKIVKGKRFRELMNGTTKTVSFQQLEILSEITGIPLKKILFYSKPRNV